MSYFRPITEAFLRLMLATLAIPAVVLPGLISAQSEQGKFDFLYRFQGQPDGMTPMAGLIRDRAGSLYGTTYYGGASTCICHNNSYGCGTVFKVDPRGNETILHSFAGKPTDGQCPAAGLFQDSEGNLYGTTYQGGSSNEGTVFKLDTTGNETLLYSFTGGTDGGGPLASLIQDADSNLYGTTVTGGDLTCGAPFGCGTVFKLDSSGVETVLYSFTGAPDGQGPEAELIMDAAGNLYGTTRGGGTEGGQCGTVGCGIVFRVDSTGNETILHAFVGTPDGRFPSGGLIQDSKGGLYGATSAGGRYCSHGGCGTVFKLDGTGKETVLHNFKGTVRGMTGDGADPMGTLIRDEAGNLYGTTFAGGAIDPGTVFRLSPARKEKVFTFSPRGKGFVPGHLPNSSLVMDPSGILYGTTQGGGDSCPGGHEGCGEVFKLKP